MIEKRLSQGELKALFIEHLGWDRAEGVETLELADRRVTLRRIAQKRGFQVFEHRADRHEVQTRRYVKAIHEQLCKRVHENILIVTDERAQVQVWLWAYRDRSTGRWRHRMHPWITSRPADGLIKRIQRLTFTLEEEERITLPDVSARIDGSLNGEAAPQPFFRRPMYARESHELAKRMQHGGQKERDEFVVFHRRLAEWVAKKYEKLTGSVEDVVQIAMIGLVRAAERYDPDRGTAFSTYAVASIQRECSRFVPELIVHAKVPANVYWRYRRARRAVERIRRQHGVDAARACRDDIMAAEGVKRDAASGLDAIVPTVPFDTLPRSQRERNIGIVEFSNPVGDLQLARSPVQDHELVDACREVRRAIEELDETDQAIIRGRVGLDGAPLTLQELGERLGITRERVRQREAGALAELRTRLFARLSVDAEEWYGKSNAGEGDTDNESTASLKEPNE